jgi:hypothetical protein
MARCPAHGNRIQLNSSRAVNLFGATPQPDCRRTLDLDLEAKQCVKAQRTSLIGDAYADMVDLFDADHGLASILLIQP